MRVSEKFDWICNYFKAMSGGEYLGFNNATFLSEREVADRNYSIAYYMKEHKCFPEKANLKELMDFYFQVWNIIFLGPLRIRSMHIFSEILSRLEFKNKISAPGALIQFEGPTQPNSISPNPR